MGGPAYPPGGLRREKKSLPLPWLLSSCVLLTTELSVPSVPAPELLPPRPLPELELLPAPLPAPLPFLPEPRPPRDPWLGKSSGASSVNVCPMLVPCEPKPPCAPELVPCEPLPKLAVPLPEPLDPLPESPPKRPWPELVLCVPLPRAPFPEPRRVPLPRGCCLGKTVTATAGKCELLYIVTLALSANTLLLTTPLSISARRRALSCM